MSARLPSRPTWAIVCAARATYLKPLFEGFADAQSEPWSTLLLQPQISTEDHAHPPELTTPVHPRLHVHELPVARRTRHHGTSHEASHYGKDHVWMPQARLGQCLAERDLRGIIIHEFSPFSLTTLIHARRRAVPVIYFGDVGQANAYRYSFRTRLWHRFWTLWVDARMAGCPAARLTVSGKRLPSIDAFHAVDSGLFQPLEKNSLQSDPVVFVFSGQLIGRKGIDLWFAAAASLLKAGHSHFRLRVVGGGDETWARGMAEKYGVAQLVEWCGFLQRESMRAAIGSADVFVLPSRWDSYAVVTHEAACLGLPLLISKHAGSAEALVQEGVTGWQIDPADTPAFAGRMAQMMDPTIRQRVGRAARHLGEQLCARRRGAAVWQWLEETFLR
jgi:glycosyltransferase involved in cell wall biosynthesis